MTDRLRLAAMAAALLGILLPAHALAAQWDAVGGFYAGQSAPAGNPWSYGYGTGGGSFSADSQVGLCYGTASYDCHFAGDNYQRIGLYSGDNVAGASASTSNGIYAAPDALFLHPGAGDGQSAIVRFTATAAGTYALAATFEALDFYQGDGVTTELYHNGSLVGSQLLSGSVGTQSGPGAAVTFASSRVAAAGDTFDFVVARNANYYSDSTGLKAQVSLVAAPVPEPGEWALMAAGLALIGGVARRRRGKPGAARRSLVGAALVSAAAIATPALADTANATFETASAGGATSSYYGGDGSMSAADGWLLYNNTYATTSTALEAGAAGNGLALHVSTTGGSNGVYQAGIPSFAYVTLDVKVLSGNFYAGGYACTGSCALGTYSISGATDGWRHVAFTTSSAADELALYSDVGSAADFLVDNVHTFAAAPVPEPGEWATMLGGLSVVGFAARRRR